MELTGKYKSNSADGTMEPAADLITEISKTADGTGRGSDHRNKKEQSA